MITTVTPDKRGRVYMDKRILTKIGWIFGDMVELDIRKAVKVTAKKEE